LGIDVSQATVAKYIGRPRQPPSQTWWATTTLAMDIHCGHGTRSPWQNAYVERLIGSIRRECLGHVIVWNERGCAGS